MTTFAERGARDTATVLFFDVDGTLLTQLEGRQYVPQSALAAMEEARERGCRIYLCTGRSLAEARSAGSFPIDGIIGAAGGFVLDGDTMIYHQVLGEPSVLRIEDYLTTHGGIYYLECNSGLYFDDEFLAYARRAWGISGSDSWNTIAHTLEGVNRAEVNKVSFRMQSSTSFEDVLAALGDDFYVVRSSHEHPDVTAGEISVKGVNKGTAIELLLDHLGLPEVRTFGFGDSMNDREMLERCDEAIVMGDARHPEVKELATYVTSGVLEDGIARAMRHFGLVG